MPAGWTALIGHTISVAKPCRSQLAGCTNAKRGCRAGRPEAPRSTVLLLRSVRAWRNGIVLERHVPGQAARPPVLGLNLSVWDMSLVALAGSEETLRARRYLFDLDLPFPEERGKGWQQGRVHGSRRRSRAGPCAMVAVEQVRPGCLERGSQSNSRAKPACGKPATGKLAPEFPEIQFTKQGKDTSKAHFAACMPQR
jgi:hypothetical protein